MTDRKQLEQSIRTAGYWQLSVSPETKSSERIAYLDLLPTLQKASVRLRGWDFPHVAGQEHVETYENSVASWINWSGYREIWEFEQSARLNYLGAFYRDWMTVPDEVQQLPDSRRVLNVHDVLYRLTELFEFASNLSLQLKDYGGRYSVNASLQGLSGRYLHLNEERYLGFGDKYVTNASQYSKKVSLSQSELVTHGWEHARNWSRDIFARFLWDASDELLEKYQTELRNIFGRSN